MIYMFFHSTLRSFAHPAVGSGFGLLKKMRVRDASSFYVVCLEMEYGMDDWCYSGPPGHCP